MRGSLLSLTRALWRIAGARQGPSQHGRPPAVAAGGLVPSCRELTCVRKTEDGIRNTEYWYCNRYRSLLIRRRSLFEARFKLSYYKKKSEKLETSKTCNSWEATVPRIGHKRASCNSVYECMYAWSSQKAECESTG